MTHAVATIIKSVNFVLASALNLCQFVAFFEQVESEYCEIIYHAHIL